MTTAEATQNEISPEDQAFLAKEEKRQQLMGRILQSAGEISNGELDGEDLYYLILETAAMAYLVKKPLTMRFEEEIKRMAQEIEWKIQFAEEAKEAMTFQIIHKRDKFFA
ncbi:MAG: hypothetical protein RL758_125 [Pseudomonadota bacterium]|jgi:hypothetical protein